MTEHPSDAYAVPALCPAHRRAWVAGDHRGRSRCEFYVPELGVSEDYGCPQPAIDAEHCHSHVEALIGGVCECPRPTRPSDDSGVSGEVGDDYAP